MKRVPTDWNKYNSNPTNFFARKLFFEVMFRAYKELLKKAIFKKPISILEFGSGTGYTNLLISQIIPTKKITLVDSNSKMMDIARHTLSNLTCEKKFIEKDFFHLDLNEKFDLVHSAGVVEHFDDSNRKKLINLHANLIVNGGYCIIYSPTPTIPYRFFRKIYQSLSIWKFSDEVPLSKEQLVNEVKDTGLKVLETNYFWKCYFTEVGLIAQKLSTK